MLPDKEWVPQIHVTVSTTTLRYNSSVRAMSSRLHCVPDVPPLNCQHYIIILYPFSSIFIALFKYIHCPPSSVLQSPPPVCLLPTVLLLGMLDLRADGVQWTLRPQLAGGGILGESHR